jgi:hypothetical protein
MARLIFTSDGYRQIHRCFQQREILRTRSFSPSAGVSVLDFKISFSISPTAILWSYELQFFLWEPFRPCKAQLSPSYKTSEPPSPLFPVSSMRTLRPSPPFPSISLQNGLRPPPSPPVAQNTATAEAARARHTPNENGDVRGPLSPPSLASCRFRL